MVEEGNKIMQKLTAGRKLQKDQYLIIVLVGILLCVIAIPTNKKESESNLSNIKDDIVDDHTASESMDIPVDYVGCWEDKLEDALRYVEGVGKVRVLITLHNSEQKVVEKDGPEEHSETTETDAAGGSRTIGDSRTEKSTIYTADGRRSWTSACWRTTAAGASAGSSWTRRSASPRSALTPFGWASASTAGTAVPSGCMSSGAMCRTGPACGIRTGSARPTGPAVMTTVWSSIW